MVEVAVSRYHQVQSVDSPAPQLDEHLSGITASVNQYRFAGRPEEQRRVALSDVEENCGW
jgi:hypothetical protein